MLLRTRLSLYGVVIVLVVNLLVVLAALQREDLLRRQFSEASIANQINVWSKIVDEHVKNMEDFSSLITDNPSLAQALEAGDGAVLQNLGSRIADDIRLNGVGTRFDLIYPDGSLAYSSQVSVFPSAIINADAASAVIANEQEIRGIGNDKERNTGIVYGSPIRNAAGEAVGIGVFAQDIVQPLIEFEILSNSNVMIVNRRGRLLTAPSGGDWWTQHREAIDLSLRSVSVTIEEEDQFYLISVLPLVSNLGGLVGRIINVQDITELASEQRAVSFYTAIAIAIFLVFSLAGLYLYMRRTLLPLNEGVNVLNALSKGDINIQVEQATRNDEVGQIASAVNVFRSNLLSFFRYRRSQERQKARQERFIYREMNRLINTLDEGEDRNALQAELDILGQTVNLDEMDDVSQDAYTMQIQPDEETDESSRDSDSLALLATAFQGMSDRVRNQHDQLREALQTKEALISLRNELDIARRVQLSLRPSDIEKSEALDIAGNMWPAKEVGGDFIDYFRIDNHRVGIAIADVSGKGVPAALFTVMARTLLRNTAGRTSSPAKVLETVNDFLEANNSEQLFVTYFYGIIDEKQGTFTYTNCGHNPPVIADSSGSRFLPTTNGIVLAMFSGIEFEDAVVQLQENTRIVLFTDGITEAFNTQDEAYGEDRLLAMVERLPKQTPSEDVEKIFDDVNDFVQEAPQFDDIACIVMQFKRPLD